MILVEIAGFLGNDPEERFTATGKRVVGFRVGVKVRHAGKDETVWWRVSVWGDRFDKMLTYLRKGSAVIIVGEMGKPELYVDRDGKTQVSLSLNAEIVKFSPFGKTGTGSAQAGGDSEYRPTSSAEPSGFSEDRFATASVGASFGDAEAEDEEIPF